MHCSIAFESYLQATNKLKPKSKHNPRAFYCVHLFYAESDQDRHQLSDLHAGSRIKCQNATLVPITQNITNLVIKIAKNTTH